MDMAPDDAPAALTLQRPEETLRLLIDVLHDHAIFALDSAGRIVSWNSGAERMTGRSAVEILGVPLATLLGPDADQPARTERLLASARRDGRSTDDGMYARKDGAMFAVITTVSRLAEPGVQPYGFAVVLRDVSESRRSEERQRVLMREVDHRTKNTLAVVQSILRLSVAADMPAFVRLVEGRIAALARIHTQIATHHWEAAPLGPIIGGELATLDPALRDRIAVSGPNIWLAPKAAQAIALAVHELATNAYRHGALVLSGGHVAIHWTRDEASDALVLAWLEQDGPRIPYAGLESFGFAIVRAMIETQLEGSVELTWSSGDLSCRLSVPGRHLVTV